MPKWRERVRGHFAWPMCSGSVIFHSLALRSHPTLEPALAQQAPAGQYRPAAGAALNSALSTFGGQLRQSGRHAAAAAAALCGNRQGAHPPSSCTTLVWGMQLNPKPCALGPRPQALAHAGAAAEALLVSRPWPPPSGAQPPLGPLRLWAGDTGSAPVTQDAAGMQASRGPAAARGGCSDYSGRSQPRAGPVESPACGC